MAITFPTLLDQERVLFLCFFPLNASKTSSLSCTTVPVVIVRVTNPSKQCGLTSGNEEGKHGPGADKLKDEAVLGGYLT